jgi:two-component system phosphate regulon sensor histidine kinase PhoR
MNKNTIWLITGLMAIALLGIVALQSYSVARAARLTAEQFDRNVIAAMDQVVRKLEQEEVSAAADQYNFYPSPSARFMEIHVEEISMSLSGDSMSTRYSIYQDSELVVMPELKGQDMFISEPQQQYPEKVFHRLQEKIASWYVMRSEMPVEDRLSINKLDKFLKEELREKGINIPYAYGIYSNQRNGFVIARAAAEVPSEVPVLKDTRGIKPKILQQNMSGLAKSNFKAKLFPGSIHEPGMLVLHFPKRGEVILKNIWLHMSMTILFSGIILFSFAYSIQVIFRQKKTSDVKTDFINNMTHEFKTPIATISLAADAIGNPKVATDPEKLARFANIIRQENKRMNSQVEKVLQMAMIDKREFSLKITDVDVHDLILRAAENISLQVEPKDGLVRTELNAPDCVIEADATHLENVINNLLDNANKYSPEKPDICIRTRNVGSGLEISVEDKGLGISKEARKNIFDKFYRVPTGNLHDIKGFGLGLSYVKAIATAHGGHVEVKSELGKGSQFIIFFPIKHETK